MKSSADEIRALKKAYDQDGFAMRILHVPTRRKLVAVFYGERWPRAQVWFPRGACWVDLSRGNYALTGRRSR